MQRLYSMMVLLVGLLLAGCSGGDSSPATGGEAAAPPSSGGLRIVFDGDDPLGRFAEATQYGVTLLLPNTRVPYVPRATFARVPGEEPQVLQMGDLPGGVVDILLEGLDAAGRPVGQARAAGITIRAGEVTSVDGSRFTGIGI